MNESVRILLIQSNKSNADRISSILEKAGFNDIHSAYDGVDAVCFFKEYSPEVVFIETKLPLMDGLSVLKKLKKINPDCLVAVTSSDYDKSITETFIKHGADGFIYEPFSEDRIIPWLIVSLSEKERHKKLKDEYDCLNRSFENRLDYERVVGKYASENAVSFDKADKMLIEISNSKNITIDKLIEILK